MNTDFISSRVLEGGFNYNRRQDGVNLFVMC